MKKKNPINQANSRKQGQVLARPSPGAYKNKQKFRLHTAEDDFKIKHCKRNKPLNLQPRVLTGT